MAISVRITLIINSNDSNESKGTVILIMLVKLVMIV